ncbi:MAG: hypothetical protein JKY61_07690 [Planctomycetes bacterium]|nr:hypothetical protein [Planctomycetota bacterium]
MAALDSIRLWDVTNKRVEATFGLDGGGACALSSDGSLLAARDDSSLRVWEIDSASQVLRGHNTYVYDIAFSPDGRTLASRGSGTMETRLWDTRDGRYLGSVHQESNWEISYYLEPPIGFTLDSRALITVQYDNHFAKADLATDFYFHGQSNEVAHYTQVTAHEWSKAVGGMHSASNLVISPDGKSFVRLNFEEILDVETEAPLASLSSAGKRGQHQHMDATFSPDSRRIAIAKGVIGGSLSGVWIHDVSSGEVVTTLTEPKNDVFSVAWSPDGTRLAIGSGDHTIRVCDTETFETLLVLRGHESYVHDLAWSPDGTQLASASGDGTVRIWDSLPRAKRVAQARAASDLRAELRPRVEALIHELNDLAAVAARLRADRELSAEQRHEALRVLREMAIEKHGTSSLDETGDGKHDESAVLPTGASKQR